MLRLTTYFQMTERARVVGRAGLGPFLDELAAQVPALRVHLIAHSVGARLGAYALIGLREVESIVSPIKSLTLLQGILPNRVFAESAPGALADVVRQVDGFCDSHLFSPRRDGRADI